jgi:hypothetical protein
MCYKSFHDDEILNRTLMSLTCYVHEVYLVYIPVETSASRVQSSQLDEESRTSSDEYRSARQSMF